MTQAQVMCSVYLRDIYDDPRRFMLHSGKFLSILALLHRLFSCQCTLVASVGLASRASAQSHTCAWTPASRKRGDVDTGSTTAEPCFSVIFQALMNQQNLTKQLESKTAELEKQLLDAAMGSASAEELEELRNINESLLTVQAEQDTLIRDLHVQVHLLRAQPDICCIYLRAQPDTSR